MRREESHLSQERHLSNEEILLAAEGELPAGRAHLDACVECRGRLVEMEAALAEFASVEGEGAAAGPLARPLAGPLAGPRALLRARLAEAGADGAPGRRYVGWAAAAACVLAAAGGLALWQSTPAAGDFYAVPKNDLTPGAARYVTAAEVCRADLGRNAEVVPAVQRRVFEEYGMRGEPGDRYEVDYLITPALGGSDDIRNLWPQPYSGSVWNAHVKDALEDRLHDMVCAGELDLATAQHDIASNWIAAYKKYFHTERPIGSDEAR